ncbi:MULTISPECIES: DUF732 domain-containing protein [unclassified Mycobacterium]|uniref:DUF732 domain-containing protein n=1 Tax=unclassified Mycobacterium TaxID=2642494 RepID=UPI0007FE5353|nr:MULTISPECIES: DUF732 domain-containing protein [unclassified Mycobacterium]OBG74496.1 glycine cleavage system P protein [Mycobacterium sp. E1214]OBH22286.1 glycine cleavage system P protein [Mycobacterium sp. E1319]
MRPWPALCCLAVAAALAAPARGEPDAGDADQAGFLASLSTAGITYKTPDAAVQFAKAVCQAMGGGERGPQMVDDLKNQNPGLTTDHATSFVAIAAKYYCPQQLNHQ